MISIALYYVYTELGEIYLKDSVLKHGKLRTFEKLGIVSWDT